MARLIKLKNKPTKKLLQSTLQIYRPHVLIKDNVIQLNRHRKQYIEEIVDEARARIKDYCHSKDLLIAASMQRSMQRGRTFYALEILRFFVAYKLSIKAEASAIKILGKKIVENIICTTIDVTKINESNTIEKELSQLLHIQIIVKESQYNILSADFADVMLALSEPHLLGSHTQEENYLAVKAFDFEFSLPIYEEDVGFILRKLRHEISFKAPKAPLRPLS